MDSGVRLGIWLGRRYGKSRVSRLVLNRSFLGGLGVRVQSSINTGVLCSEDRASRSLRRLTKCFRHEAGECSQRLELNTRGQRRESDREEMGEYLIQYSN